MSYFKKGQKGNRAQLCLKPQRNILSVIGKSYIYMRSMINDPGTKMPTIAPCGLTSPFLFTWCGFKWAYFLHKTLLNHGKTKKTRQRLVGWGTTSLVVACGCGCFVCQIQSSDEEASRIIDQGHMDREH